VAGLEGKSWGAGLEVWKVTAYRSTILNLLDRHCPRALDFAESGVFRDRELFQAGIAAHAILQAIGEAGQSADHRAIAEGVVRTLVTEGRAFDGIPEPPMSPQQAADGRDIALRYLSNHPMPEAARYEIGLAVDKNWKPIPYASPDAYYKAAIDVLEVIETEAEDGYPICIVSPTDWKSAWPTDESEVETIQLRGQAALAWAHYPNATVLLRRAVNLRTGARYEAETIMDEDGAVAVAGWRADIAHAIAAAEVRGTDGRRPARPGSGCMGCPYLAICPESIPAIGITPQELALEWMSIEARRSAILPMLKSMAGEEEIVTSGGTVGYSEKAKNVLLPDGPRAIANAWFNGAPTDAEVGILTALKLGSSQVDAIAKVLHPFDRANPDWKSNRAEFEAQCLGEKTTAEFGVIW